MIVDLSSVRQYGLVVHVEEGICSTTHRNKSVTPDDRHGSDICVCHGLFLTRGTVCSIFSTKPQPVRYKGIFYDICWSRGYGST